MSLSMQNLISHFISDHMRQHAKQMMCFHGNKGFICHKCQKTLVPDSTIAVLDSYLHAWTKSGQIVEFGYLIFAILRES